MHLTLTKTNINFTSSGPSTSGKRALQNVLNLSDKAKIISWMKTQQEQGVTKIPSKAIAHFPQFFKSAGNANLKKASRLIKDIGNLESLEKERKYLSVRGNTSRIKKTIKARKGRGRKTAAWVIWFYDELVSEFERYKRAGLKFSPQVLRLIGIDIVENSTHPEFKKDTIINGLALPLHINFSRIQQFMEHKNIVLRHQTGKLSVGPEKRIEIDKSVAKYLGLMKRLYDNNELDENFVSNMDETHFIINVDNGKTLGFRGDDEVKYADVSSGGEGMTMVLKISGGEGSMIQVPMMIFKNAGRSYPIRGLTDDVTGVCYRTGPNAFMNRSVFLEWLKERRVNPNIRNQDKNETIFLDNYGGHNSTPEILAALEGRKRVLNFLPPNATDLIQPLDSFVISKIKDEWTRLWEAEKLKMIREGVYAAGSGKLRNPAKCHN